MHKKLVRFFCFRHGEKDGDKLTKKGVAQVQTNAARRLMAVPIFSAYYSGMHRALETVQFALEAIGQHKTQVPIFKELGFGLAWLIGDPVSKEYPERKPEYDSLAMVDQTKLLTVNDCLQAWPPAWALLGSVHRMLLEIAKSASVLTGNDTTPINMLVGSHSPTIELPAALLDKSFPKLKEGDMVLYHVDVHNDDGEEPEGLFAELVQAEYFPCPNMK